METPRKRPAERIRKRLLELERRMAYEAAGAAFEGVVTELAEAAPAIEQDVRTLLRRLTTLTEHTQVALERRAEEIRRYGGRAHVASRSSVQGLSAGLHLVAPQLAEDLLQFQGVAEKLSASMGRGFANGLRSALWRPAVVVGSFVAGALIGALRRR